MMKRLIKKLNGYQKAPRARFKLLLEHRLTQEEFLLYELVVAITDWDARHETYGTVEATNQELAELLGWRSDTTALAHKKSLIKKGILYIVDGNRIKAKGFDKWQRASSPLKIKDETAERQLNASKIEDEPSEIKEDQSQNNDYSLVSSKVDLSSSNEILNESLSDEELESILTDINHQKSLHEINEFKSFNV